jgi:hypothetical protein
MTRICPNCGFKVQNDLLMICPECRQSLSDEIAKLSPEEENRVIRRLRRTVFRSMFLFAGVLTIITLISLWSIKEGLEEAALERIDQQFEEPRIQSLLEGVVQTKTQDLMEHQIEPELKRFRQDLADRASDFGKYQSAVREKLQRDYETLSNDILRFKKRSTIYELGDTAIEYMSRPAYEDLLEIVNEPSDPSLQLAAKSEITRINTSFMNASRTVGFTLSLQSATETEGQESDITTPELLEALFNDADWKVRARSAQLLADKKELGVPEALIESMKDEDNLEVLKDAVRAFEAVTGYRAPEILGYEYCSDWWEVNSSALKEKLEASE